MVLGGPSGGGGGVFTSVTYRRPSVTSPQDEGQPAGPPGQRMMQSTAPFTIIADGFFSLEALLLFRMFLGASESEDESLVLMSALSDSPRLLPSQANKVKEREQKRDPGRSCL